MLKTRRFAPGLAGLCAGLWLCLPCVALAEDEDSIATDRPDFVETASTVGRGVFQIETSVAFDRSKLDGRIERTWTTPTLLRYGVAENVELRLETDGFAWSRGDDGSLQRGFSDVAMGVKWRQQEADPARGRPAIGWLLHMDGNTGSAALRALGAVPSLRMVAEWELPGDASLAVMPGVRYDTDDMGRRHWSGVLAGTYGRPLNAALRGFVEVAGRHLARSQYGGSYVTADMGVIYLINKDVQLDGALVFGLGRRSGDLGATLGLSTRFR